MYGVERADSNLLVNPHSWLYSALFSLMISAACGCAVDALMISAACGSPERAFRVVATKENSTCSFWLKRVV